MTNKVLSIEIGLETTKICEIDYKKKNPKIYQCLIFETPPNIIEDGYIRDKNSLAEVMKQELQKANIKNQKVIFTIASTKISNREITIPMIKEDKIQDLIMMNGNDYFPVDISEYILTYNILQKNMEENIIRLLVFAAPNNLIKNYYSFAELMGFEIVAMDYFGNSSYQLVRKQVDSLTNLVIHMNEQSTLINILENNVLMLQRTIAYGSEELINIILTHKIYGVTNKNEVLNILRQHDFIRSSNGNLEYEQLSGRNISMEETAVALESQKLKMSDTEDTLHMKEEITESLKYLVSNVIRVIDYYRSKNKDTKINAIYITGTGAKFKGIEQLFKQETDLEVKRLEKLVGITFEKSFSLTYLDENDYISCIGATLQPIDFLPKEKALKNLQKTTLKVPLYLLLFSAVASIVLVGSSYLSLSQVRKEKKQLEQDIAKEPDMDLIIQKHTLIKEQYANMVSINELATSPNEKLVKVINDMEQNLPSKMVVQSINFNTNGFTLNITTDTKESVAKFILQLKRLNYLRTVELSSVTETKNEYNMTTVSFSITCTYNELILQKDK